MSLNKYILLISFAMYATSFLVSCEKFVAIATPSSQLPSDQVFEDESTANAAVGAIYSKLRDEVLVTGNLQGLSLMLGSAADELEVFGQSGLAMEYFYVNNINSNQDFVAKIWNDAYSLVYAANSVLERLGRSRTIAPDKKQQLTGEALFLRAYIHHYLLNLYGSIPYVTTTDYAVNRNIPKLPVDEVSLRIIGDLKEAKQMLSGAYPMPGRTRANRFVATALLARVMLYGQDWVHAEQEATQVIDESGIYQWVDSVQHVFLNNSTGTLLQFYPELVGRNTLEAQSFIFTSGPPPNQSLTHSLVSAFEPGDRRKLYWMGTVANTEGTWYFPYKYKERGTTATAEQSIVFRLEELYLIRAEARIRQGHTDDGLADLNKLRLRAGLTELAATDDADALNAVLRERRVELFCEQGHRWFDLKRMQMSNQVLGPLKPGWDITDTIMPIPEKELLMNPNIRPQNPGYE